MEIKKIILFITALLLFGCTEEVYDAVSRSRGEPFTCTPVVNSFVKEDTIYIS